MMSFHTSEMEHLIVKTARELVGKRPDGRPLVPFKHQGRDPRTGVDCIGVAVWTCHQLGIRVGEDFTGYQRVPEEVKMVRVLDSYFDRTEPRPGVLLCLRSGQWPMHVGIIGDHPGPTGMSLIHSWMRLRGVVEHGIPTSRWTFTPVGAWALG